MIGVPVIIPAYRAEKRLPRVLDCVARQDVITHTFIRDNSEDNIYYTAAVNEGLLKFLHTPSEYMLILSDDVFLDEGCLTALIRAAETEPRAGIISPIQVDSSGRIVWSSSLNAWPSGIHGIDDNRGLPPYEIPWASGAVLLVRTSALRECGVMDRNMRFICSDADLSLTFRARGWRCLVAPDATVTHDFDGSINTTNETLNDVKVADILYFTEKWLSGGLFRALEHNGERIGHQEIKNLISQYQGFLKHRGKL